MSQQNGSALVAVPEPTGGTPTPAGAEQQNLTSAQPPNYSSTEEKTVGDGESSEHSAGSAGDGIGEGGDRDVTTIDIEKLRYTPSGCTTCRLTFKAECCDCLEMVPKFGDGGGWQIATSCIVDGGLTPGLAEGAVRLTLAAGGGGAIWIFVGNYAVGAFKPLWNQEAKDYVARNGWANYLLKYNVLNSLLWAVPGFVANGLWQTFANAFSASSYIIGGIKTGFCTGASFMTSLMLTRGPLSYIKNSKGEFYVEPYNFKQNGFLKNKVLWSDAEISMVNVTAAGGMFVWTDSSKTVLPFSVQTTNKITDLGKDVLKSSSLTASGYAATRALSVATKAAVKGLWNSACCFLRRKPSTPTLAEAVAPLLAANLFQQQPR